MLFGGAHEIADSRRKEILFAESVLTTGKNFYYISADGDDNNDGKSPETPIRSIARMGGIPVVSGTRFLFRRGDKFRLEESVCLRGGVGYGSYGEGPKPIITGSRRDYADESIWSKHEENIWKLELPYGEAGVMTFNEDTEVGFRKTLLEKLLQNKDYFHDMESGILYLYCDKGNPGVIYQNIEIGTLDDLLFAQNVNCVKIDNLCLKHANKFAMNFGNNKEITITNCEIGWIGGAYYNVKTGVRYGNGIQFWYRADECVVKNCWIYEVFDAAITFQGSGTDKAIFREISFKDNLIEKCSMNIEYWAGRRDDDLIPIIQNISVCGNIIRMGGYGFGGIQRPDLGDQALFLAWDRAYTKGEIQNFRLTDNIFDCADGNLIWAHTSKEQEGMIVKENTYYQCAATGRNPYMEIIRGSGLYADNQETLEKAVSYFEENPKEVKWIE